MKEFRPCCLKSPHGDTGKKNKMIDAIKMFASVERGQGGFSIGMNRMSIFSAEKLSF